MNEKSYGHAYLSSYGWEGIGTALRNGAIEKPLAIPPKKNLSGLGKDRDEAFPFWDHLFTAASKAITIKVSSDNEDTSDSEDASKPNDTNAGSLSLKRTTTGIISNRRPVTGTSASTSVSASGTTTPNPNSNSSTASGPDTGGRLLLIATAKREAAKRGLYSRFFRGPVIGPDDDPDVGSGNLTPSTSATTPSAESDSSSVSTPAPEQTNEAATPTETTKKSKKRKSGDREETKGERRERKRLKKERKAAKAAKKARKLERALEKERTEAKKDGSEDSDRKVRKRQDKETRATHDEERGISQTSDKSRKRERESAGDAEVAKTARKKSKKESPATDETVTQHIPADSKDASADGLTDVLTAKKKKGKRKDTTP